MKSLLAVILTFMLLMGTIGAALCENTTVTVKFTPTLTNGYEHSDDEWFESADSRARLTIALWCDMILDDFAMIDAVDLAQPSFVAKDGTLMGILMPGCEGSSDDYLVIYEPSTGQSLYANVRKDTPAAISLNMMLNYPDGSYENDVELIAAYAEELAGLFEAISAIAE